MKMKVWGIEVYVDDRLKDLFILEGENLVGVKVAPMSKTIRLSVDVEIPVTVAQDMMADRVLEVLRREVSRAANKAVSDFVTHGVKTSLEDLAIRVSKSTEKVS